MQWWCVRRLFEGFLGHVADPVHRLGPAGRVVGVDTDFGPQQLSARLGDVGGKRLFELDEAVVDEPLY
jgi:hypothetical protein